MNSVIATATFFAQRPGEDRFAVTVKIGTPYRIQKGGDQWACPVAIDPLFDNLVDIQGSDSLQALCFALRFAMDLLNSFEADGGVLTYRNGERFPVDAYLAQKNSG